jgi:hypothetical protein
MNEGVFEFLMDSPESFPHTLLDRNMHRFIASSGANRRLCSMTKMLLQALLRSDRALKRTNLTSTEDAASDHSR